MRIARCKSLPVRGFTIALALLLSAMLACTAESSPQSWPARPIRLLISTPAGGSPDLIGRIVAEKLAERLGQPIVVENSAATGLPACRPGRPTAARIA